MRNKYILMRHGETRYQARGVGLFYSKKDYFDISITAKAKKQIKETAKKLKKENIDLIYCSDLYRAKQTAIIITKELGLKINIDKRLRDMSFGIFAGGTALEYKKIFSSELQRFSKRPSMGESWRDVKKRAVGFIKEVDKKYKNKTILIISHADPIWILAGFLKGLTEKELLSKRNYEELFPNVGKVIKI